MDTERIVSFVAAAEAGSLTGAAARLGRQLSGVSRHLGELEAELGVRLFDRTGRGVRLTAAGERFLERGRQVLRELELARAEARGERRREPDLVRLSAPPDLSVQLLPGVLAALAGEFPSLVVQARADARRVSVMEEAYDAVVRLGPLSPSDLIARPLGTVTMGLYAPPGRGLGGLAAMQGREVVRVDGFPPELSVRQRRRRVSLTLAGRLQVSSFSEAGELAARLGWLAVLPSFSALPFLTAGRLSPAARGLSFAPIELHLLFTQRHRGSAVMESLGRGLAAALAEVERAVAG